MDHMMPDMDGLETMKAIRKLENGKYLKLPMIVLTANAVIGARDMLLQNGFDEFLSKPIEVDKLNSILAKWLPTEKLEVTNRDDSPNAQVATELIIPGIDVKKGIAISGGSIDNYIYLLGVFRKDGEIKLRRLEKCLNDNDLSLYTTYVHAIKSACINIAAKNAIEAADALEAAGLRSDVAFILENNDAFIKSIELLMSDIDAAIADTAKPDTVIESIDYSVLKQHLLELKDSLESFDIAAIDKASAALQDYTGSDAPGGEINGILQNAFTSKFKQAARQIEELLRKL